MPRELVAGLGGVSQVYGTMATGGAVGIIKTEGSKNEVTLSLTGEVLATRILSPVRIPAGTVIKRATLRVYQAFDLATSSVVRVGTSGSEATNGLSLTEAQLEAIGNYDVSGTLAGTYTANTPLTAASLLGVAFSAGSVTNRNVGRAVLVIETERMVG